MKARGIVVEDGHCFFFQLYIYDLSQGMARTLGQQLIGRPLEGIWHTAVVVHGKVVFKSMLQWTKSPKFEPFVGILLRGRWH